jgi:hypothetical protein
MEILPLVEIYWQRVAFAINAERLVILYIMEKSGLQGPGSRWGLVMCAGHIVA